MTTAPVASHFDRLSRDWEGHYRKGGNMAFRIGWLLDECRSRMPAGSKLLDYGSGSGDITFALGNAGYDVTGLDVSLEMIERARRRNTEESVRFVHACAEGKPELPFRNGTFDGCVASSVLEYIPDASAALAELRRVIKSGGSLVLTVPNPFHPLRWIEALERKYLVSGHAANWYAARGKKSRDRAEYLAISRNRFSLAGWRFEIRMSGWNLVKVRHFGSPLLLMVCQ